MSRVNPFAQTFLPAKILIGIITAHHPSRTPHVAAMRDQLKTKGCPIPYKFVYGDVRSQKVSCVIRPHEEDELFFDCDDTREYMVEKDKALFKWALKKGFNYVFRICDDTQIWPERLVKHAGWLIRHDYAGTMCGYATIANVPDAVFTLRYLDYMHGGVGIWLSEKSMRMLIADDWKGPMSSPYPNNIEITPGHWHPGSWGWYWDDLWIGEVLKGNLNFNDPRRNNIYENYLVQVLDDPTLFASNLPYDENRVISAHSLSQMGTTDLKPKGFSTRTGEMTVINVDWGKTAGEYHEVKAGSTVTTPGTISLDLKSSHEVKPGSFPVEMK
jgi:hypothetical protein